jgi:hypothetical protein
MQPAGTAEAERWLRRLAWLAWITALALALAAFGLLLVTLHVPIQLSWGFRGYVHIVPVIFATIGLLIATRLPRHPIGWLFLYAGLGFALQALSEEYAIFALMARPGALPGGEFAAWIDNWLWVPLLGPVLVLLFLLFPDGRLLSRRWWLAIAVLAAGTLALAVQYMLQPGPMESSFPIPNPYGVSSPIVGVAAALGFPLFNVAIILAVSALIVRMRRASGAERDKMKWLAFAAAVVGVTMPLPFLIGPFTLLAQTLVLLGILGIPVAVGIAILRHRLYDIDLIIRRALVYAVLSGLLGLLYFGAVIIFQTALRALTGTSSQLVVVASTLAIAALFNPLRRRVQAFIDRRFYRRKYDAAQTLAAFAATARDETDLDALAGRLVSVVDETVQPAHASLWLAAPSAAAQRYTGKTPP